VNSPTKCQIPLHGPDRTGPDRTRLDKVRGLVGDPRGLNGLCQRPRSETRVSDKVWSGRSSGIWWTGKLAGVRGGSAMHRNDARLIFRTFCDWQPCSELVARRRRALKAYSQHTSSTKLQFENSSVNSLMGKHVLRINRALTVLVSLQPITAKYSRDADARDQSARVV